MEQSVASRQQIAGLSALLDHDGLPIWAQGGLPPLGHWLCFPPDARQSTLGVDGHPIRLDEHTDLPRRMWAGSRIRFHAPIPYESPIERRTTTLSSVAKHGRSGRLHLVTLHHEIMVAGVIAVVEEQDIVYREAAVASPQPIIEVAPPPSDDSHRRIMPDEALLFRYSALTFNAHRIHYDLPYATAAEGYPGLVVHGPLTATLLLDHYLRLHPNWPVAGFSFRALAPIFAGRAMTLGIADDGLTAFDDMGRAAMAARVEHA